MNTYKIVNCDTATVLSENLDWYQAQYEVNQGKNLTIMDQDQEVQEGLARRAKLIVALGAK